MRKVAAAGSMLALGLSACGDQTVEPPAEAPVPVVEAAPAPALVVVDLGNAQQFAREGSPLVPVELDASGAARVQGRVEGEAAPVYAVAVGAGQTLTVTMQTDTSNLYFNVSEAADHSGAAVHRGEVDGAEAQLTPATDATYVITPFQPRATARRGEAGDFTLMFQRR